MGRRRAHYLSTISTLKSGWAPVDEYSKQQQTIYDSHVPYSPPCLPVDQYSEQDDL